MTRRLIYAGIVLAAGISVVLHYGNGSGIPGRVAALGQWTQSMERSWSREVPFPANGTVAAVPEASDDTAPFMVQTPYQPDRRYVVALKEWHSGALVARIYLDANTVITVPVKSGQYRVVIASGQRWEGDAALFGRTTRVEQGVRPARLSHGPRQTTGFSLYLMATDQPNFPPESLPRADFPVQ